MQPLQQGGRYDREKNGHQQRDHNGIGSFEARNDNRQTCEYQQYLSPWAGVIQQEFVLERMAD